MYPINSKTIFVLDGGPAFAKVADRVDFDFHKSRTNNPSKINKHEIDGNASFP